MCAYIFTLYKESVYVHAALCVKYTIQMVHLYIVRVLNLFYLTKYDILLVKKYLPVSEFNVLRFNVLQLVKEKVYIAKVCLTLTFTWIKIRIY